MGLPVPSCHQKLRKYTPRSTLWNSSVGEYICIRAASFASTSFVIVCLPNLLRPKEVEWVETEESGSAYFRLGPRILRNRRAAYIPFDPVIVSSFDISDASIPYLDSEYIFFTRWTSNSPHESTSLSNRCRVHYGYFHSALAYCVDGLYGSVLLQIFRDAAFLS